MHTAVQPLLLRSLVSQRCKIGCSWQQQLGSESRVLKERVRHALSVVGKMAVDSSSSILTSRRQVRQPSAAASGNLVVSDARQFVYVWRGGVLTPH